jgi:hypothetical protein
MGLQLFLTARMITLLQRLGLRVMLMLSCGLPGIAYILLARTTQPLLTVVLVACIVAFFAWQEPLVNNQLNKKIGDESRATTLSALSLIGSLTGIGINPWIGALGDQGLDATGTGLRICLILLCVPIFFFYRKSARRDPSEISPPAE